MGKTQWTSRVVTDGGFGWVWDEADIEGAAEYLHAVAVEN